MTARDERNRRIDRALERTWPDRTRELLAETPPSADRSCTHVCLIIAEAFEEPGNPSDDALSAAATLALSACHSRAHERLLDDRPASETERDRLILAGDLLQAKAFEVLGRISAPVGRIGECYAVLTRSCMWTYEIASTMIEPERRAKRSAAFIGAAARLGGLVGGASDDVRNDLETSGAAFGWQLATPPVESGTNASTTRSYRISREAIEGLATLVPKGRTEWVRGELRDLVGTRR